MSPSSGTGSERAQGRERIHTGPPASRGPFLKRPCTERVDAPLPARRPTEAYPQRYGEGGQRRRSGCSGPRMPGSEGMDLWRPASQGPRYLPRKEDRGQCGDVGDGENAQEQDQEEGDHRPGHLPEGAVEPVGGEEEVHPHRGHQEPELEVREEDDPEVDGMDVEGRGEGGDDRNDDDDRRENVHETPDDQQEAVQDQEERVFRMDRRPDPLEDRLRHPGIDQVAGEPRGRREEDEESPHEPRRFRARLGELSPQVDVPVYEHLDAEGVQDGDRGRLDHRREPPEDPEEDDHREEEVPFRLPRRGAELPEGERRPPRPRPLPSPDGPRRHDRYEENPREQPPEEHLVHRDPRHDGVKDHRQARREQEPERPGGREEPEAELLGIPLGEQRGEENAAESDDGHARSAGEGREEGAHEHGDHGDRSGHPAHQRPEESHQPAGYVPGRQEIPREGEQGDGGERRGSHQPVDLHRDGGDGHVGVQEEDHRQPPQPDEKRPAKNDGRKEQNQRDREGSRAQKKAGGEEDDRGGRPGPRRRAPRPRRGGVANEPPGDEPESGGDDALRHPTRQVRHQEASAGPLQQDHPDSGPGKDQRDRGGDRREEAGARPPEARRQPVGKTPQREVPPIPRRERAAEKPDPECGVLHERRGAGDAGPPELAAHDLGEGKSRHTAQEKDRDRVLDLVEERPRASARDGTGRRVHRLPGGRQRAEAFAPPWVARYSSRNFRTSSKTSAGMIFPRICGWMSSTIFRHSASAEGETWVTFSPFLTIAFIASSFRFRISRWSRLLASREISRIFGLISFGILSQAFFSMTVAPVRGAHRRSAMFGARANHWKASAARGVALNASIRPVCRPGRMSTTEIGTGLNPASL